jgi:CubicO group peptidase (beta-lactamase class C family)
MKSQLYLIFALLFLSNCSSPHKIAGIGGDKKEPAKIDVFLKHQMDSLHIPGMSIAIINSGKVVYQRVLGVANMDTKIPVAGNNIFDAGSLSKSLFAYFVFKSIDDNKLALDTPLYTYLPNPDIANDERYKLITARMVLSHSSGFPNWRFQNPDRKLDIKFMPGTDFNYSGEGYEYLANVLAHLYNVSKDSLSTVIQQTVFTSLGMLQSSFTWTNDVEKNRADGHVKGKVADGYGISRKKPGFYAAYSLQTSATDYAKFLVALMNGTGLSKSIREEAMKIQIKSTTQNRSWGLGIEIETLANGKKVFKHGGFNNNFSCGYLFSMDTKNGYVYFTNSDTGNELFNVLHKYFLQ